MTIKIDSRNRAPAVSRLPDLRLRIQREYDVTPFNPSVVSPSDILASVWLNWGIADSLYTSCRLVKQDISGQIGYKYDAPNAEPPRLIRVYEELPASAEQIVGDLDLATDQDNILTATRHLLQFSSGPDLFGRVGVDSITAGTTTCVLKSDERTNDGTLKTIARKYISAGELSRSEDIKDNGALVIKQVTAVNQIPTVFTAGTSTWTIIAKKTDHVSGVPVYSYTWASGYGQISQDIEYRNSVDEGAIGLTIYTVKFLTPSSTLTNPINPLSAGTSFILVQTTYEDQDGYRIWTSRFGRGRGTIISEDQTKEGGRLLIYNRTALGAPPTAPTPSLIAGTSVVTLIKAEQRRDRFHEATILYDYQWAEGAGLVADDLETQFNQRLIIYHRTSLGSPPATPAATISGSVTLIENNVRQSDGYAIYDYKWAEGNGLVTDEYEYRNNSRLVIYHRVAFGAVPDTPSALIGGVVTLIDVDSHQERGYVRYERRWAEGMGVVIDDFDPRNDGLGIWKKKIFSSDANVVPFAPVVGALLIKHVTQQRDGFVENDAEWMLTSGSTLLPLGTTVLSFSDYVDFTYPGRAKTYTKQFALYSTGNGYVFDLYKSPPIKFQILATHDVSYQTSAALGALTNPLWNPTDWAAFRYNFQGTDGYAKADAFSLYGYLSAGTTIAFTAPAYPSSVAVMGQNAMQNSSGSLAVTGGPADPAGATLTLAARLEPAFVGADGTQYYRKTVVYGTVPTPAALPV